MSVQDDLAALRALVAEARGMPMSASCVLNRQEVLDLVDRVGRGLPDELGRAQGVLASSADHVSQAEDRAARIVAEAERRADELARDTEVARRGEDEARRVREEAQSEAAGLRREVDSYVDSRMADFESVLHKTLSQVSNARSNLARRSGLDEGNRD